MKTLLTTLLLLVSAYAMAAPTMPAFVTYDYPIIRVIDGDTVVFKAAFLPAPLKPELSLRVWGIDTPEKGALAKCQVEADRGKAASLFTLTAVNAARFKQINVMKWDKYGGRVLGDVILDGKSLREMLKDAGYAKDYYGGFKFSWCN